MKRTIRSPDREVRTPTENISDEALDEVVAVLLRRVGKVDRSYDIPYMGPPGETDGASRMVIITGKKRRAA